MKSLLEFYSLLLLVFCISIERVDAQFMAEILQPATRSGPRRPVERCEATGASFGADVASFSFGDRALGCAVVVEPNDACTDVTYTPLGNETTCVNLFAIVPRGKCNFSEKAYHVQRASPVPFAALIIYNSRGKPPVDMMGGKYSDRVHIPVIMVSFVCMEAMINKYPVTDGFMVRIKLSPGYYDLFRYLIPFVVVVGFCFLVLLVSLAIRLCREHRRIARKRLSKRNLRKIPTKKYRKGDHPDTCAICLDDFVDGEKLRVLPCRHCYHCKCIDPWLTQNRKVCPMCKRRVGEKNSDSESSDDEERRRQMQPSTSSSVMTVVSSVDSAAHQMEEGRRHTHEGNSPPQSPVPTPHSSVSNVLVEVHHGLGGSREQLVEDEFLSDQEAHREQEESDLDEDEEAEASLSQSLKKRLKGLFNRSNNGETSNANTDTESGRVNGAFAGSIHSLSNETRDGGGTAGGSTENRENQGEQGSHPHDSDSGQPGVSSDRFRDPFDDSHVAATSASRDRDATENAPTAGVDAEGERK